MTTTWHAIQREQGAIPYDYFGQFTRRKYAWLALVIGVTGVAIVMVMAGGLQYFLPAKDDYPPYSPTMRKGEVFVIPANALHPTQAVVGMREVQKIIASFNNKSTDKLAARLQNTNTVMIIGPGGVPYLTDGHHAVRALLDSNQENKNVYGIVLENWSAMAPGNFGRKWWSMATPIYLTRITTQLIQGNFRNL